MTHDDALQLSKALAAHGLHHTVSVRVYPHTDPPVQARVDLVGGSFRWDVLTRARGIGQTYGVDLEFSAVTKSFTFVTPAEQAHVRASGPPEPARDPTPVGAGRSGRARASGAAPEDR